MDSKEVKVLITGAQKTVALYRAIREGVNWMWAVSVFVCNEDATLELKVKTIKLFLRFNACSLQVGGPLVQYQRERNRKASFLRNQ